jgi:hypothetical protein
MACNSSQRILAIIIATGLYGCSAGNVARPTVISFRDHQPYPKDVTVIPGAGVPRFAMGRRCPSTRVIDTKHNIALYAFQPGVGSRLQLNTWSAGLNRSPVVDRGNTYLPIQIPTLVSLRLVAKGKPLDQSEEAVLATVLTTSRTEDWKETGLRKNLNAVLESHQAELWNALVRNLCVQVSSVKLEGSTEPAVGIASVSNISALCKTIPIDYQIDFTRLFIKTQDNIKPCTDGSDEEAYRTINGEGINSNSWPWSQATLSLTQSGKDIPYLDNGVFRSHNRLFGQIEIDSVKPWNSSVPTWSLQEWEDSGICQIRDQPASIDSLKLHGANRWLKVALPSEQPSHRVLEDGGRRRFKRLLGSNPLAFKISRNDLRLLTAADVTGLQWKTGLNNPQVSGCDRPTP